MRGRCIILSSEKKEGTLVKDKDPASHGTSLESNVRMVA